MNLDPNVQPVFRALNAARLNDRMIDEFDWTLSSAS